MTTLKALFPMLFEQLPVPAAVFRETAEGPSLVTGNRLYRALSPAADPEMIRQVSAERSPLRTGGGLAGWLAVYQPLLAADGLCAVLCCWQEESLTEGIPESYIGLVSHELKAPVTALQAGLQLLQKQAEGPPAALILENCSRQLLRLRSLIDGFLDAGRLGGGPLYLAPSEFSLDDLLEEVLHLHSETLEQHRLRVLARGDARVRADREKIASVIGNLVSNAVKYSPRGSLIELSCFRSGQVVRFSVRDQGIGISPADQARIFDRHYRAAHTGVPGHGLGLYLSAEIIRRHGGALWVNSEPGKGSAFQFCLSAVARQLEYAS